MNFLLHLLLCCSVISFAQNTGESLIVVHYDEENKSALGQHIYRYNYVNSIYAGREKVLTVEGRKTNKDYIRFDKGDNVLYKDRYLISGIGNIIDLKEKKVVHDGSAKLVSCSNDSIIFYVNDIFKGKYYTYFDLTTNTYSEIKSLTFKPVLGQDVELDINKSPYKLEYFPKSGAKVLLMEDAGHGGVAPIGKKSEIPVYWIDDNTFLFPNIKLTDLEGVIVKYNLSSKTAKTLGTFTSTQNLPATYNFNKRSNSLVEFYFKEKLYMINPVKETMLISNFKEVDANFSIEVEAKPTGRTVYYKGKDIGKKQFQLKDFKTCNNYAAIVKETLIDDELHKQGLLIYNISVAKWESIGGEEVANLVGWIKK